jgi:hypothetical protein
MRDTDSCGERPLGSKIEYRDEAGLPSRRHDHANGTTLLSRNKIGRIIINTTSFRVLRGHQRLLWVTYYI